MKLNNLIPKSALLITVLGISALVFTQAFGASIGRKSFKGSSDNNRNFATLESDGQLQTTFAITSAVTSMADVRLDSVQDAAAIEISIDLTKFTTGFSDRDGATFGRTFLDFSTAGNATFKLIDLNRSRAYILNNEQKIEVSGRGELRIGSMVDTVTANFGLRYLEQNEVTKGRMPGDLLHMTGDFSFRLSKFGIRIPQEALLRLEDVIHVRFDIYNSTQG